jgi:predicted nucleic acid-binding protein
MIVVADTSPLHYLVLIGQIDVLPLLYGQVLIPPSVVTELSNARTPEAVRQWAADLPVWVEVRLPQLVPADFPAGLGPGERQAITLCQELGADALLIDDWDGRQEAERRQLTVIGTLRILAEASDEGLLDLSQSLSRLRATNFRASAKLLQQILDRSRKD